MGVNHIVERAIVGHSVLVAGQLTPPEPMRPASTGMGEAAETSGQPISADALISLLDALARMARASRRHEADFDCAARIAGLRLTPEQRAMAVAKLASADCIERLIPLLDGGLLVSVTRTGMGRSGIMA
jgi:hypothetical protein